jgi:tRNA (mo5U34)-methyltransferase
MPNWRSLAARGSARLRLPQEPALGPLKIGAARPRYGGSYKLAALPPGMSAEALSAYVGRMHWYHGIELRDGVVTPAMKPAAVIEDEWRTFALGDLAGKSVLDIGGIDGAYAFAAERAGARRVAVLDHYLWSTDADEYARIYQAHVDAGTTPPAPHESAAWHPDSLPTRWRFDTARQALGSQVKAIVADFMDCDLGRVGRWDVVLYLGVLYHIEEPMRALRRLAAVTREQAIIETHALLLPGHPEPLWSFFPGGELNHDRSNWWAPNIGALLGAVGAAGFRNAEILAGEPPPNPDAGDNAQHYRAIVRAIK